MNRPTLSEILEVVKTTVRAQCNTTPYGQSICMTPSGQKSLDALANAITNNVAMVVAGMFEGES